MNSASIAPALLVCVAASSFSAQAAAFSPAPASAPGVVVNVRPFEFSGGFTFNFADSVFAKANIAQRLELRYSIDAATLDIAYGLSGHHTWSIVGVAWQAGGGPLTALLGEPAVGGRVDAAVYGTLDYAFGERFAVMAWTGPAVDAAATLVRHIDARVTPRFRAGIGAKVWKPWVHAYVEGSTTFDRRLLYSFGGTAGLALVWPFD